MYEKQAYKDNYVDPTSFFDQLKLSRNQATDNFQGVFIKASIIVEQYLIITIFLTTYKYLLVNHDILVPLAGMELLLLITGFIVHRVLDVSTLFVFETIQNAFLFGVCLRILAPILKSLTLSFSSNTIHALSITLSCIHLSFFNYGNHPDFELITGSLSLNAALFLAIILASRLADTETVVVFLMLAVMFFCLLPKTTHLIRKHSVVAHLVLTCLVWTVESVFLFLLDKVLFVLFEVLLVCLWILGPHLFLRMQSYKGSLNGPWDIQWI